MIKNKPLLLVALAVGFLLTACKTELNMNDLDGKAQIDLGLALPIGSMQMSLGDILGSTPAAGSLMYDSTGTLLFKSTYNITKKFHPVTISEKSTNPKTEHMHMADYYNKGEHHFEEAQARLTFDVGMQLAHVNDSLDYERFDKVLIRTAEFYSVLNYRPAYGDAFVIPAEWIDKIDMILGDQFEREGGKTVNLYKRGVHPDLVYKDTFKVKIDEFSMKLNTISEYEVANATERNSHATDSIHFKIRIQLNTPDVTFKIDDNSAFEYWMTLGMIDYRAVWGMFSPSNEMRDEGTFRIAEEWDGWKDMDKMKVPFSDPEIRLNCVTQIAGQMRLDGDYLYVKEDKSGKTVYAEFDGKRELHHVFTKEESLSINSEIGDSATLHLLFDKDKSRGHIDNLFTIHPDEVGYNFIVDFADHVQNPIARITDNTDVTIHATLRAPFSFNEGLRLEFGDTIRDLDLGILNKDSLKKHVEWIDSLREGKVYLALNIENTLPLAVDGEILFLDKMGRQVMYKDSTGNLVPLQFWGADTLHISAPTFSSTGDIIEPGKCATNQFKVNIDQLDALSQVNRIFFRALADDKAFKAVQDQNPDKSIYPLRINKDASLRIRLGVAAKAGAIFDFNNLINKEK